MSQRSCWRAKAQRGKKEKALLTHHALSPSGKGLNRLAGILPSFGLPLAVPPLNLILSVGGQGAGGGAGRRPSCRGSAPSRGRGFGLCCDVCKTSITRCSSGARASHKELHGCCFPPSPSVRCECPPHLGGFFGFPWLCRFLKTP